MPNLSAWRRSVTGDLTAAIDFAGSGGSGAGSDVLTSAGPQLAADAERMAVQCAEMVPAMAGGRPYPVPTPQTPPTQEPGRPRRPSGPVCGTLRR